MELELDLKQKVGMLGEVNKTDSRQRAKTNSEGPVPTLGGVEPGRPGQYLCRESCCRLGKAT